MANPCLFGAEPVAGAPPWFQFDDADLAGLMPPLAGTLTLMAMGVPSSAQNTADFVAAGPPDDLATDADIALLSFPLLAIAGGAYRRLGNTVRAKKWSELAVCIAAPDPPAPAVGGGPWRYWGTMTVHGQAGPDAVQDFLPRGPRGRLWRAKLLDDSVPHMEPGSGVQSAAIVHATYGAAPHVGQLVSDLYPHTTQQGTGYLDPETFPWQAEYGGTTEDGPWPGGDWDQRAHPELPGPIFYGFGHDDEGLPHGWNGQLVMEFYAPTLPEPEEPALPVVPDDYPTGGGICETPSLGDLCRSISAINAKIDALIERTSPPEIVAPDEPVPVEPVPDPPPGEPVPTKPVDRPTRAIGAVIKCTTIPDWQARFGNEPLYYPALGHVTEITAWGPRPSVLIAHNPLVLLELSPQTETLQLDLGLGVAAEVTWLYGV